MNTLVTLGHIALFGTLFFTMFCRLNKTNKTTPASVRWALIAMLSSCLIEMLIPLAWPHFAQAADYFFIVSTLYLQLALSHKWGIK